MKIIEAWDAHLRNRTVETRNKLVELLISRCVDLTVARLKKACIETVTSEIALYLIERIDRANWPLKSSEIVEDFFCRRFLEKKKGRRMKSNESRFNLSGQANTRAKKVDVSEMFKEPVAIGSASLMLAKRKSKRTQKRKAGEQ